MAGEAANMAGEAANMAEHEEEANMAANMAGEAANNQEFCLCLPGPDNQVKLQADERNVIKQIEELIDIKRRIRNGKAGIADLLEEYETRKEELTEDPDKLAGIVDTYLCGVRPLVLMDASNNIIHTF